MPYRYRTQVDEKDILFLVRKVGLRGAAREVQKAIAMWGRGGGFDGEWALHTRSCFVGGSYGSSMGGHMDEKGLRKGKI